MGHTGLQKHGLLQLQGKQVQEVDGKASDITGIQMVQLQQELPLDVLPVSSIHLLGDPFYQQVELFHHHLLTLHQLGETALQSRSHSLGVMVQALPQLCCCIISN